MAPPLIILGLAGLATFLKGCGVSQKEPKEDLQCHDPITFPSSAETQSNDVMHKRIDDMDIYTSIGSTEDTPEYLAKQIHNCRSFIQSRYPIPDITEDKKEPWKILLLYVGDFFADLPAYSIPTDRAIIINALLEQNLQTYRTEHEILLASDECLEARLGHEWIHLQMLGVPIEQTYLEEGFAKWIQFEIARQYQQATPALVDKRVEAGSVIQTGYRGIKQNSEDSDTVSLLNLENGQLNILFQEWIHHSRSREKFNYIVPLGSCVSSAIYFACFSEVGGEIRAEIFHRDHGRKIVPQLYCEPDAFHVRESIKTTDNRVLTQNFDEQFAGSFNVWDKENISCSAGNDIDFAMREQNDLQGTMYFYACFWDTLNKEGKPGTLNRVLSDFFEYQQTQIPGTPYDFLNSVVKASGLSEKEVESLFETYGISGTQGTSCYHWLDSKNQSICWPFWEVSSE